MIAPALHRFRSGGGNVSCPLLLLLVAALALLPAPCRSLAAEKVITPVVSKTATMAGPDGEAVSLSDVDATVGEAITFRLEGTLPSNWDEFSTYRYEFHDEPSDGLVIDYQSVSVSLVGADGSTRADLTGAFTVTPAATGSSEWACGTPDLKAAAPGAKTGDRIVLSYKASLDPAKASAGTSSSQKNVCHLDYTSKPFTDAIGRSKESEAAVSTWALSLYKVDAQDQGKVLSGAAFTLQAQDGRYVTADGTLSSEPQTLACDSDGHLQLSGLGSGVYALAEVAAPDGYSLPDAPWHIAISYDSVGEKPVLGVIIQESGESFEADAAEGVISLVVPNARVASGTSAVNPASGTPKTGDSLSAPFVALAAIGLGVAVAALVLRPRNEE